MSAPKSKIIVMDTTILCLWLEVPGYEATGPAEDRWDRKRVKEIYHQECQNKSLFVLPLAVLLETGRHIIQAKSNVADLSVKKKLAQKLSHLVTDNLEKEGSQWVIFTAQASLWQPQALRELLESWQKSVAEDKGLSLADATIQAIADYYCKSGYESVDIWTADQGLKALQPVPASLPPPRRR